MVNRACGFVLFDTEEDFNDNVMEMDESLHFQYDIIERPNSFPAVYQYHKPWDTHFCGHWKLCEDGIPMLKALESQLESLQKLREKIAKTIDSHAET